MLPVTGRQFRWKKWMQGTTSLRTIERVNFRDHARARDGKGLSRGFPRDRSEAKPWTARAEGSAQISCLWLMTSD